MNLISKVLLNQEYRKSFEEELAQASQMLKDRAKVFLEEAEKIGLKTLPFSCGFFITIPCSHPEQSYQGLVKRKIHVIPLDSTLRITIAAISLEECRRLPKEIYTVLNNCE